MKNQYGTMKLLCYSRTGFNRDLIMTTSLEGTSFLSSFFVTYSFDFSFRSANTHTDSLGEVDVISDAEVS